MLFLSWKVFFFSLLSVPATFCLIPLPAKGNAAYLYSSTYLLQGAEGLVCKPSLDCHLVGMTTLKLMCIWISV